MAMTPPGSGSGGSPRTVAMMSPAKGRRAYLVRMTVMIVAALALAYLAATLAARSASGPHPSMAERWPSPPLVIAHQGGDELWPGNTRLAFANAADLGADVLEMDVHLTADGHLAVIHDATVDRTTDASGAVSSFTVADLASLDAGHAWSVDGGATTPYRGGTGGVPALQAVLDEHPSAALVIELKDAGDAGRRAAGALCTLLRSNGRSADALVASFHASTMRTFREVCPEVATSAVPHEVRLFVILSRARIAGPYVPPFDAIQVPVAQGSITVVTPSLIRAAHAKGVQVHVWTIDEVAEMERLLELGVDGIITDRPDRMLRLLGRSFQDAAVPAFVQP